MLRLSARALPALALAAALFTPEAARACGGFFCSNAPIDQTGEKIVFAKHGDELVTVVQVQYAGTAEEFSWVLPVPGLPTLETGTDQLFANLDQATTPRFWLNWHEEGVCSYGGRGWPEADGDFGAGAPSAGGEDAGGDPGVTIVSQAAVGPYDSVILQATDPDALLSWLADNDYDVTPEGQELLRLYVDPTRYFVALKLRQDKGIGDLVPIALRYREPLPCVPIRLTAVAAQQDMGITAFVLGDSRAVPLNYFHVQLNEARIDWLNGGANYTSVLSEAVDAASNGQAFATEFAGRWESLGIQLYDEQRFSTTELRATDDPVAFVDRLLSMGLRGTPQLLAFFQRHVPMPATLRAQGVDDRSFYNCLACYAEALAGQPFDPDAATDDLDESILQPLARAQELLDVHPYLTRLGTTMSPEEMTADPYFHWNLDLGDVSNTHTAELYVECGAGGSYEESPARIETPDGSVIRIESLSSYWRWGGGDASGAAPGAAEAGPAAAIVEKIGDSGAGEVIEDNRAEIEERLAASNAKLRGEGGGAGNCAGCGAAGAAPLGFGLLGLLGLGRRRRS